MSESRERVLAGLPLTERRERIAGAATSILEGGDGPPLVLLHGGIECGGAVWAPVVAQLAASHRLVIPDVPGLGESEPLARLDPPTVARWLAKRIDDSELRRIPTATELLWGRHDRFVPLGLAEATSARLGWPLRVIDDAGHVPHIERPEAFLAALSSALDSNAIRSEI